MQLEEQSCVRDWEGCRWVWEESRHRSNVGVLACWIWGTSLTSKWKVGRQWNRWTWNWWNRPKLTFDWQRGRGLGSCMEAGPQLAPSLCSQGWSWIRYRIHLWTKLRFSLPLLSPWFVCLPPGPRLPVVLWLLRVPQLLAPLTVFPLGLWERRSRLDSKVGWRVGWLQSAWIPLRVTGYWHQFRNNL